MGRQNRSIRSIDRSVLVIEWPFLGVCAYNRGRTRSRTPTTVNSRRAGSAESRRPGLCLPPQTNRFTHPPTPQTHRRPPSVARPRSDRSRRAVTIARHVGTSAAHTRRPCPFPHTDRPIPRPSSLETTGQQLRGRVALPGLPGGDRRGVDGRLALGRWCVSFGSCWRSLPSGQGSTLVAPNRSLHLHTDRCHRAGRAHRDGPAHGGGRRQR